MQKMILRATEIPEMIDDVEELRNDLSVCVVRLYQLVKDIGADKEPAIARMVFALNGYLGSRYGQYERPDSFDDIFDYLERKLDEAEEAQRMSRS